MTVSRASLDIRIWPLHAGGHGWFSGQRPNVVLCVCIHAAEGGRESLGHCAKATNPSSILARHVWRLGNGFTQVSQYLPPTRQTHECQQMISWHYVECQVPEKQRVRPYMGGGITRGAGGFSKKIRGCPTCAGAAPKQFQHSKSVCVCGWGVDCCPLFSLGLR